MTFQMRNWYYFTWLSGDYNVEQHVHGLDKCSWAMRDKPPVKAWRSAVGRCGPNRSLATFMTTTPWCLNMTMA